ncbi:hypothetical protein K1T71_001724 [Dendrolimus kikuchii]|uniref:Uncharacterized protein n=1 Tax=Dendrolimus kikuchii TaxID=765133 RepID=A0ACC1DER3_9NEOP|nr:hypothetical protein K1T71_001724 [Dendrolimus kikuchii]
MDPTPSTSHDGDENDQIGFENELTNKFLSGKMTFAEYSNEWYSHEPEEDIEEDISRKSEDKPRLSLHSVERSYQRRSKLMRLSPALLGLMGEANLRFARGDIETAERMCHEIIKQVPTVPEPYQTLAQIYERDHDKFLQFSLLAAHLSKPDAKEWLRLAALSKEMNDVRQEVLCYTQAIKAEPWNLDLHLKRLEIMSYLEEMNHPMQTFCIPKVKCYHKIVQCMPEKENETIMKYAKLATTMYHSSNELEKALEVMAIAYRKCSSLFTMADINIFLELLISQKQFHTCIEVFVASVNVDIEAEIQTVKNSNGIIEEQTIYTNCFIPNDLPIDLRSKLLVCFIHLGATELVKTLLNEFLANDVERAGDLYMDIEEALSSVGHHELAMQLLEPLVKNTNFDLGAVWLKHAECLYKLDKEDEAVISYYKVLEHAPQHPHACYRLYAILEKKGEIDAALKCLKQDYKYVVSAKLLYEQCQALKKHNKLLDYLEAGEALLSKTFVKFRHTEELSMACRLRTGIDVIHSFRTLRGENPYHENDLQFDEAETFKLTAQQEKDLFLELLEIAVNHKEYVIMQRLTFGALMSRSIALHRQSIDFYCFQACLLNHDYPNSIKFIKEFSQKFAGPRTWNLLNFVFNAVEENYYGRFLNRIFQKEFHTIRNLFLGNGYLTSGRYLVALKYFLEYHDQCREPLSALLIAVSILAMAAQKTVDKHHNLILQGIAYLQSYQNLRKCDQETNYNLGRAYHMLNINNLAIEYYERALTCGPITTCSKHGVIDLTRETAYNLYLIYKNQSPAMARKYLMKYLVI